jgi:hypothetical protein
MPIRPPVTHPTPPHTHTNKPTHKTRDQEQLFVGRRQKTGTMGAGEGEPALVQQRQQTSVVIGVHMRNPMKNS